MTMRPPIMSALLLLCVTALSAAAGPITIGAGPAIGVDKRGTVWFEEFQDWTSADLRALDPNDDQYKFNNAHDPARDIIAFYSREEGDSYYFRVDFFDLLFGSENADLDLYVAIDCALGGQEWFPDFTDTRADPAHPWNLCVAVYNAGAASIYDQNFNVLHGSHFHGSYWRSDLDAVEFGISRQALLNAGWNGSSTLYFQIFTTRDGTNGGAGDIPGSDVVDHFGSLVRDEGGGAGRLYGAIPSHASGSRAKYAVISHANQSLSTQDNTMKHIYTDRSDVNLHPGFVRMIDSHEMLGAPLNMHLSGSLISSLLWAEQDPSEPGYPNRDGPAFLAQLKDFVDSGVGSLIGGVYAEHIMPYFEGEVNLASIRAFNDLALESFGLTTNDMKVMHIPERVFHSNTGSPYVSASGMLQGKPFQDILDGGYEAAYLDEVVHLHWWFYPNEQWNPGWDDNNCGRWAGGLGNDEEPYHHKVHKINGVYCFMINDREDQSKFGPDDGGMQKDTRYTLLQKALSPDYGQVTIVFDDWEAFAGNSFTSPFPNNNADQWHDTIRWAANHPWIEIVNLKDVLEWAKADPGAWVIDHGTVFDKSTETYEWLKRATEKSYDHWYYGSPQEESFFARVPGTAPSGFSIPGTKIYGDLNTPGTLLHDAWQAVRGMPAGNLRDLAEWTYSSMIYETAWHDEDANPDQYKSRNYQVDFNRGPAEGNCDVSVADTTWDPISGWALKLHGHVRKVNVHAHAAQWLADILSGAQGPDTVAEALDVDDDLWDEYVLKNDHVYLVFERWGARLVSAFAYDPVLQDVYQVIGAPVANPAEEHDGEGADNLRASGFKDRWSSGTADHRYVDLDFGLTPPVQGPDFWEFVSEDGAIRRRITLDRGRDAVRGEYLVTPGVGQIYTRFGLGPNQRDLLRRGPANLVRHTTPTWRGLENLEGGGAYVVAGGNTAFVDSLANAGWNHRALPLVEQFEIVNTATNYSVWLAFSQASADDIDGDGLSNEDEIHLYGTDFENPDSDGDGIPDGYEAANDLNPLVNDAHLDKDGDGVDNLSEYLANTRANDPDSVFRIVEISRGENVADVHFTTAPNRRYRIEYADVVDPVSNLVWRPFLVPGTGQWLETAGVETNRWLRDAFDAETSGAESPSGVRIYRLDVSKP